MGDRKSKSKPDQGSKNLQDPSDRHWDSTIDASVNRRAKVNEYVCKSFYLTMRDGIRVAIDVNLPSVYSQAKAETLEIIPTVIRQTRYFRRMRYRRPFAWLPLDSWFNPVTKMRQFFLGNGYAWVDVDVRGTGASFGRNRFPWAPEEVKDGGEIVDWIISQPWSNGKVCAWGNSYEGTTAEFLVTLKHPAVVAAVPAYALFDSYPDVVYPGGIPATWFTKTWASLNRALDKNKPWRHLGPPTRATLRGVMPVDEDRYGADLSEAVLHRNGNYDIHMDLAKIRYRDDEHPDYEEVTLAGFSPDRFTKELIDSKTPLYSYSGWYDGAYSYAAIKRFLQVPTAGSRLIIGPWDHGAFNYCSAAVQQRRSKFQHGAEIMRFFDSFSRALEPHQEVGDPIRYFTMGEERWKSSSCWPPEGVLERPYFLAKVAGKLTLETEQASAKESAWYEVDLTVGTGAASRWRSLIPPIPKIVGVRYGDRSEQYGRFHRHVLKPLQEDLEITGHPRVHLWLTLDGVAGDVFVYLEDRAPSGKVTYVSEGMLRLEHRKVSQAVEVFNPGMPVRSFLKADSQKIRPGQSIEAIVDILPVSWLFQKGHSIQVSIAAVDCDHFASQEGAAKHYQFHFGGAQGSRIYLPVQSRRK